MRDASTDSPRASQTPCPGRAERTHLTRRLAASCARHPSTVGASIGAIVLAVVLVSALLGDDLTSEGHVTNDP